MSDYDMLQPLGIGCGWAVIKNNISANPLLELKYIHRKRKKKFSFQEYVVVVMVEVEQKNIDNVQYKISAYMQPCDSEIYLLEYTLCANIESAVEKVKYFTNQYQNLHHRGIKQIQWTNPIDYVPIKIPTGWEIVLNSFVKGSVKISFCSCKNTILSEKFDWERDISAFKLEHSDYEIFVELQEYTSEDSIASLLHIHVYFNRKDNMIFFEQLESVFCFTVEEAQEQLNKVLWKYRNGLINGGKKG